MGILKKVGSLLASALMVLILSGFVSLRPLGEVAPFGRSIGLASPRLGLGKEPSLPWNGDEFVAQARHESAPSCVDVTGVTSSIPSPAAPGRRGGIADSGSLDFDVEPPVHSSQTCGMNSTTSISYADLTGDTASTGSVNGYAVDGWAWNTNLGWVSFTCKEGANSGSLCSTSATAPINYGSVILEDGSFRGWAWGDNIGWISMACEGGENLGVACGNKTYGVHVYGFKSGETDGGNAGSCTGLNRGDLYGEAYTESVGYMDFCRAKWMGGTVPGEPPIDNPVVCSPETCDGTDNDCDGQIDEEVSQSCSNICGKTETQVCSAGSWGVCPESSCTAPPDEIPPESCTPAIPPKEVCGNLVDEDCVGGLNNGCTTPEQECTQTPDPTEICDGQDNDCSGEIDEGGVCWPSNGEISPPGNAEVANGTDAHQIIIKIPKQGGGYHNEASLSALNPPVPVSDLQVTDLNWNNVTDPTKPHLRADQISNNTNFNGAYLSPFTWDDAIPGLKADLTAIAPTNNQEQIILNSLKVQATGGWNFQVNGPFGPYAFIPAVSVEKIGSEAGINTVSAVKGLSKILYVYTTPKWDGIAVPDDDDAINIYTQLHDCDDIYYFLFDEGNNGVTTTDVNGITTITETHNYDASFNPQSNPELDPTDICTAVSPIISGSTMAAFSNGTFAEALSNAPILNGANEITNRVLNRFVYTEVNPGGTEPSEVTTTNSIGIRTRVEYITPTDFASAPSTPVRYFSFELKNSALSNQSASIKGNVKINVLEKTARISESIGEKFSDSRTRFLSAIQKISRGVFTLKSGDIDGVVELPAASLKGAVFYKRTGGAPCRLIFNSGSNVILNANATFVTTGCDVYFVQNVYNPMSTAKLGIVALADFTLPPPRQGGNVYICANITDLKNVHIAADGSIFSIGDLYEGVPGCGVTPGATSPASFAGLIDTDAGREGLPKFTSPLTQILRNQLTMIGSFRSNNTYGGSLKYPPEAGDGSQIKDTKFVDTARFYDYNFLRYASSDATGACWADDVGTSSSLLNPANPNTCGYNNPTSYGIVNIEMQLPAGLPIFKDAAG